MVRSYFGRTAVVGVDDPPTEWAPPPQPPTPEIDASTRLRMDLVSKAHTGSLVDLVRKLRAVMRRDG